MSSLSVGKLQPGVVIEIGSSVRVTYCVDRHGPYLRIDAPRELDIKRVMPGTCHNQAALVCPRCSAAVSKGRRTCGACGKEVHRDD